VRALVLPEPGSAALATVDDPAPAPGEVVVAVGAAGICGTDLHLLAGSLPPAVYPLVPGHEVAGKVVATGRGATLVNEGQQVAVDPSVFCGGCPQCRAGWPNLCANWGGMGITRPGGLAEYVAVPASWCEPLPEDLPTTHGALVEPLACALHALDRAGAVIGRDTLVFGAGPMGCLLAALFRHAGARSVSVVDPQEGRLQVAERLGATATAPAVDGLTAPDGWHVVVDASGAVPAIEQALRVVRPAGRVVIVGVTPPDATARFLPYELYAKEVTVVGSMAILHSFGRARDVLTSGLFDPESLITHTFALDDVGTALDTMRQGRGEKVLVLPGKAH